MIENNFTFQELISFTEAYQKISNEKMSLSAAFKLSQLFKKVNECIAFYQDKYTTYLQKYAETEEEGGYKMNPDKSGIVLKKDSLEEAQKAFRELDEYKFPLTYEKIPLSAFEDLQIAPSDLSGLLPFIEE